MAILAIYFILMIVVNFIYGINTISQRSLHLENQEDIIGYTIGLVLWPITYILIGSKAIYQANRQRIKDNAQRVINRHGISVRQPLTREQVVSIDESDLKYLMFAFRKSLVELDNSCVIIIREELMNRNAEKNLMQCDT